MNDKCQSDTTITHHRRSVRLKGYDYSQVGAYFITLCIHNHECLFGHIVAETDSKSAYMVLNEFGLIVQNEWTKTAELRETLILGESVIMPNHFHGIITLINSRGTARRAPTSMSSDVIPISEHGKPTIGTIPTIVRSFKSAVTKCINAKRGTPGDPVWQRNYYEHVIRNEKSYSDIAAYIANNPKQWEMDKLIRKG